MSPVMDHYCIGAGCLICNPNQERVALRLRQPDARLASEDARECGAISDYLPAGDLMCRLPSGHPGDHHYTPPRVPELAEGAQSEEWRANENSPETPEEATLPSPAGTDAETLAEMQAVIERALRHTGPGVEPGERLDGCDGCDAEETLSGLVALVEQLQARDRDREADFEAAEAYAEQADELLARYRQAEEKLRDIATREWRDEGGRIAAAIARDGLAA